MKNLNDLPFDIEFRSYQSSDLVAEATVKKMTELSNQGYRFVVGNHPTPKVPPYESKKAVKISQVNHRLHGKCIRTIWAVKGQVSITLTNDFHRTEVTLIPSDGILTVQQVRRAKRKLCGIRDCSCGDDLGRRGPQSVEVEAVYHPTTGLTSAIVVDENY